MRCSNAVVSDRAVCFLGRFLPELGGARAPPFFHVHRQQDGHVLARPHPGPRDVSYEPPTAQAPIAKVRTNRTITAVASFTADNLEPACQRSYPSDQVRSYTNPVTANGPNFVI